MSLQARMSQSDPRLYNVNRDCAHNFGDVMREVAARLEDEKWQPLKEYLQKEGVTMEDLGAACQAACIFVQTATQYKEEKMGDALVRSGWWKVPEPAQVALCAMMGTVLFGYFWTGVRSATLDGVGPCQSYGDLRAAGERASKLMTMPRWKKRWYRFKFWLSGIWSAVTGRTSPAEEKQ